MSNCTSPPGSQGEGNCTDGIDNDGDGFPDESDPDCVELTRFDEIDNDGDGLIDSEDEDCGGNNGRGNPGLPPVDPSDNNPPSIDSCESDASPSCARESPSSCESDRSPSCARESRTSCESDRSPSCDRFRVGIPVACESNLQCVTKAKNEQVLTADDPGTSGTNIDFLGFGLRSVFGAGSAEKSQLDVSAKTVYSSKTLNLEPGVKKVIILIPDLRSINNESNAKDYFFINTTISKGTSIRWINTDPSGAHDLRVIEISNGKDVYSKIDLKYQEDTEYTFLDEGTFTYSYSNIPSPFGTITVVNNDIQERSSTSDSPVVGVGLVPLKDKEAVSKHLAIDGSQISSYEIDMPNKTTSLLNDARSLIDINNFVLMIWSQ